MNSAIILGGGSGTRLNSNLPKQFIEVNNGKKIIDFSIEAFEKNKYIDELVIVLPEKWINKFKDEYKQYKLVIGGKERCESSKKGLLACSEKTKNICRGTIFSKKLKISLGERPRGGSDISREKK